VHKLQAAFRVRQKSPGRLEIPNWDQASQTKTRDTLNVLADALPDPNRISVPRHKWIRSDTCWARPRHGAAIRTRRRST
jgi:hypothetical protein